MSAYQNTIILKGYLGKDAESRTNSNQTPFTVLSLATKSSHKDKSGAYVSRTEWHRVVAYGKLADSAKALRGGDYVQIRGEMQSHEFAEAAGQSSRRFWEVRAHSVEKLGPAPRNGSSTPSASSNDQARPAAAPA